MEDHHGVEWNVEVHVVVVKLLLLEHHPRPLAQLLRLLDQLLAEGPQSLEDRWISSATCAVSHNQKCAL
jgi:hypothetical protein